MSASVSLAWSGGSGATSHNVYFGTNSSPSLAGNVGGSSYNPGALADATTYYWRIEAVNGDGTTSGPVWSFTTDSGGSSGGSLYSDDFESGGFNSGAWSRDNSNARVKGGAALSGAYGAELKSATGIETVIALGGASSITVDYERRVIGFDSGETLTIAIYEGGALRGVSQQGSTGAGSASLTVSGLSGGDVTLRFSTNANRKNEKAYVDTVVVTAN